METDVDFKLVARELITALRGLRSQNALSKSLGFSSNQMSRWESGTRLIGWNDFVKLCELVSVDLKLIIKTQLGYSGRLEPSKVVRHLIGIGQVSLTQASQVTTHSRSVLTKWVNGISQPTLSQILSLLQHPNGVLAPFTQALLDGRTLNSLLSLVEKSRALKDLYYAEPLCGAVLALIDLECWKLAENNRLIKSAALMFGCEEETLSNLLEQMVNAGFLKTNAIGWEALPIHLDTRGSFAGSQNIRKFWFKKNFEMLEAMTEPSERRLAPFFIFSLSQEGERKLREAQYKFATTLKAICEGDEGVKTSMRVVTISDFEYTHVD